MIAKKIENIEAEIEAMKARIRRLRLERKVAELAQAEAELLRIAREPNEEMEISDAQKR